MKFFHIIIVGVILHICQFSNVESRCPKSFRKSRMLAKCCSIPSLISDDIRSQCTEPFNEMDYIFPHRRHHHGRHHHHKHHFKCFMECAFNETGILTDDELNLDNLNGYLETIDEPNLIPIVRESFEMCNNKYVNGRRHLHDDFELDHPRYMYTGDAKAYHCNPRSAKLMKCALRNIVENCPDDMQIDSEECNRNREYNDKCSQSSSEEVIQEFPNVNALESY